MTTPDRETLEAYLARGMSSREIAEAITESTGELISPARVRAVASELGLSLQRYDPDSVIPESWRPIKKIHRGRWDLRYLRQIDARRRGTPLSADPEKAEEWGRELDQWIKELKEQNAVIRYYPETEKGFWWWVRMEGDGEFTSTRRDEPAEESA